MIKTLFASVLFLVCITAFSQTETTAGNSGLIPLEKFVAKIKSENPSLKNAENINVMINDLLIENQQDYLIDPKNVARMEILATDAKGNPKKNASLIIAMRRK